MLFRLAPVKMTLSSMMSVLRWHTPTTSLTLDGSTLHAQAVHLQLPDEKPHADYRPCLCVLILAAWIESRAAGHWQALTIAAKSTTAVWQAGSKVC